MVTTLHTHTHTPVQWRFVRAYPGEPVPVKVKPIWILLKQETVSGSGISWAICKSAPRSRQTTMPATHHSVFYRPDALPAAQPTASKHWRQVTTLQATWNALTFSPSFCATLTHIMLPISSTSIFDCAIRTMACGQSNFAQKKSSSS